MEALSRAKWAILVGVWKIVVLREMWIMMIHITQGVPENTRKWFTDYSYNILAKKMAVSLSCSKNLPESKLRSFGLLILAEEISRQPSIDCVMWLLVISYADV